MWNGELRYKERVGEQFTLAEAKQAARLCGLNVILQVRNACCGDLDKVAIFEVNV